TGRGWRVSISRISSDSLLLLRPGAPSRLSLGRRSRPGVLDTPAGVDSQRVAPTARLRPSPHHRRHHDPPSITRVRQPRPAALVGRPAATPSRASSTVSTTNAATTRRTLWPVLRGKIQHLTLTPRFWFVDVMAGHCTTHRRTTTFRSP